MGKEKGKILKELSSYGLTGGSIQKVEKLGQARIIEEKRKMDPPIKSENDDTLGHSCPSSAYPITYEFR